MSVVSCPWPERKRTKPFLEITTVTGSSMTCSRTVALAACSTSVRRSSPYVLAASRVSRATRTRKSLSLAMVRESVCASFVSFSFSAKSFSNSRFANCRNRNSRMSSACSSVNENSFMRTALGLSSKRTISMTRSIASTAIWRPCKMCRRVETLSNRD